MIRDLIFNTFKIRYDQDHVSVMLRDMGFSWQKPRARAKERDEERIRAWRVEKWPEILKKTPRKKE